MRFLLFIFLIYVLALFYFFFQESLIEMETLFLKHIKDIFGISDIFVISQ